MSERLSLRKDTFPSSVHGQGFLWLWCWFSVDGGWGSVDGGWGSGDGGGVVVMGVG